MTDYMVLSVEDEKEADVLSILREMLFLLKDGKGNIIYVGSIGSVKSIALKEDMVLPFSSFVDNYEDLEEARRSGEAMIFFDSAEPPFPTALHIMENTSCLTYLHIGDQEKHYGTLVLEAAPNTLAPLILASDGNRIFPYPRSLECTRELIMDMLINVDSLTSNPFFKKDAPFFLVREGRSDIDYEEIVRSADAIGIPVVLKNENEIRKGEKSRAILSFSSLGHEDDLTIYFGLPFWYINAKKMPDMALGASLSITKIIGRGYL